MPGADASLTGFDGAELDRLFIALKAFPKVALAVSGGADSMALMVLVSKWLKGNDGPHPEIVVLSVDHRLRQSGAQEVQNVLASARALGFEAHALVWRHCGVDVAIQARARQARYDLMTGWCRENGVSGLVTAHHLNDQTETVLMRLARGSGIKGLSAIRKVSECNGIKILRPLLDVDRGVLEAFLVARKMTWAEDPTNTDMKYERARLRHLAGLLDNHGLARQAIARSAQRLARADVALDEIMGEKLAAFVKVHETGYCLLDRHEFARLPDEIAVRMAGELAGWAGGWRDYARMSRIEGLAAWMKSGQGRARTLAGARIIARRHEFVFAREAGRIGRCELSGDTSPVIWDNRFRLEFSRPVLCIEPLAMCRPDTDFERPSGMPGFVFEALPVVTFVSGKKVMPFIDLNDVLNCQLAHLPRGIDQVCR